ncbi:hypothetical protein N7475_007089 [Penicillium sp. IBT 31633x]|nr:hypothetical protein N7475_007089 [Penicillium sp. IBT 31633x]
MDASRQPPSIPPANPPSVEIAYKRKCIALKKRLAEVEAENELMRTRNRRGSQYIQKMRLETCMLLERLAKVTGMADEAKTGAANPELRARAAAIMNTTTPQGGVGALLEDETEGSSDEQPRTPEERPLRVKRSRKSNAAGIDGQDDDHPAHDGHPESADPAAALPRLAPAPTQESLTHSFRVQTGNGNSTDQTPAAAAETVPESGTTPMDMDKEEVKETKVEQS